jgi:hypothetical protein
MNIDTTHSTRHLMHVTGFDTQFERLVEGMIHQVRHALGVPASSEPNADPRVEQEFAMLRQRLQAFRAEYEHTYHELFLKYLGHDALASSAAALSTAPALRYFSALREMEPELVQRLRDLSHRMGETPVQAA